MLPVFSNKKDTPNNSRRQRSTAPLTKKSHTHTHNEATFTTKTNHTRQKVGHVTYPSSPGGRPENLRQGLLETVDVILDQPFLVVEVVCLHQAHQRQIAADKKTQDKTATSKLDVVWRCRGQNTLHAPITQNVSILSKRGYVGSSPATQVRGEGGGGGGNWRSGSGEGKKSSPGQENARKQGNSSKPLRCGGTKDKNRITYGLLKAIRTQQAADQIVRGSERADLPTWRRYRTVPLLSLKILAEWSS